MTQTSTLVYNAICSLSKQPASEHAQIRQELYNTLQLSNTKQFALYSYVLGPASAGKIFDVQSAVNSALDIIEPTH
ncbi:PAS factor family protein [Vibrio maerlii]|uniref:PAS factor family protein n=1 Tax=Vibrio maerlii TaxID=2231648 RepID=UPI000E3DCA0F|nr:PAS factor family protein [Vibrio maerlii]